MAPLTDISRAFGQQQQQAAEPISRTMQYRKITKPLLERQRRARINRCLDELKDILVNGLQSEGENVARLEKADILELTVRHLHKLTAQQQEQAETQDKCIGDHERFRAGFAHCAQEVSRALASTPRIDIQVGTSLMVHLGHALNSISSSSANPLTASPRPNVTVLPPSGSLSPAASDYSSYRPYTPPSSPEDGSCDLSMSMSMGDSKSVWRPW